MGIFSNRVYHIDYQKSLSRIFRFAYVRTTYHSRRHRRRSRRVSIEGFNQTTFQDRVTELIDCGTNSDRRCDYPDFAVAVARRILSGEVERGIVVCGSGVGVSVAANKIPGIRAAICHDTYSARQGVEHDDMNVLCIGGRIIGSELAFRNQ